MQCGKPNCACATDRASRHGPYYQLSWKEKGKTVSRRLPAEHATLYRQWIANRQRLQSIIQQMHGVSQKAHRHLLPAEKTKKGSAKPETEEHTSELQSLRHLVCRLLLEKK